MAFNPEGGPRPESGGEEKLQEQEKEEGNFEDLVEMAQEVQQDMEAKQEQEKREVEERAKKARLEREQEKERDEAAIENISFDHGRAYYFGLATDFPLPKELRDKVNVRPESFTRGNFFMTGRRESRAYPIERVPSEADVTNFLNSAKRHLTEAKQEAESGSLNEKDKQDKLREVHNLERLLEGFSSEAYDDDALFLAVEGYIAAGKLEDPAVAEKIKQKVEQWREGDNPDLGPVVRRILQYQKEKQPEESE